MSVLTHLKKMPLKFCSNLSFMFTEKASFLDRYNAAAENGFKAVESGFPLNYTIEQVVAAKNKSGVEHVLINIRTGDTAKGELGITAQPNNSEQFNSALEETIQYAKALNCQKIHVMAGKLDKPPTEENYEAYLQNITHAAQRFKEENICGLIEPINNITVPGYYLNSYDLAIKVIDQINSPYLRLMLDIFHLQQISGSITNNIKTLMPYIGHVQIAQVPDRHEPNSPGEVNYKFVLQALEEAGYNGYVGLEYKPKLGLSWIRDYGYTL